MEEPQQTDPAKELAQLVRKFTKHNDGHPTIEALSTITGIAIDDPELLEVLAAIQRRASDLVKIAEAAGDHDFDDDARALTLKAARDVLAALHPRAAAANWDVNKNKYFTQANVNALTLFSVFARRYKPLRLITKENREKALASLAEAKQKIAEDPDLEVWEKTILQGGLDRVTLAIRHLEFFGHDAALAEMLLAHRRIVAIEHIGSKDASKRSSGFRSALRVLRLAVELFILPHEALEALHHYQQATVEYTNAIVHSIEAPAEPPRLITDQTIAIKPKEPAIENEADAKAAE